MGALESLLEKPENQFYLPAVRIDEEDLKGSQVEAIGQDQKRRPQHGKGD